MIYLDEAATSKYTIIDDIVVDAITTAMRDSWMNPSSLYATNVKEKINKCRNNISNFIGAKPEEIYFTSGSSESNNWAIRGWADANKHKNCLKRYLSIITTRIEHKSIIEAVKNMSSIADVFYCDVDNFGLINYEVLDEILCYCDGRSILVSVHMANNEIGTLQNIEKISKLVHEYGGILHVDATQAFGHIPINVEELGIDMMSCSGHKISPVLKGIGFLYKKNNVDISPLIYGAQENGLRGGTENTYGIIGLNKAVEYCDVSYDRISEICSRRDYFIGLLESKFGCELNGDRCERLPNNINVILPDGVTGESVLYMLSMSNIFISTSSACNSKSVTPSHVLKEIGLTDEEVMRSIRITIPEDITYEDINYFIYELDKVIRIIKE